MASIWAKVDALLPVNPKAFAAGFWGTTIFAHLILINKAHGCQGLIPANFVRPGYLARYLQIDQAVGAGTVLDPENGKRSERSVSEIAQEIVKLGLRHAADEHLIAFRDDGVELLGWGEEWGQAPTTSAERGRKYREKQKNTPPNDSERDQTGERSERSENASVPQTSEENRVDQNRVEERTPIVPLGDAPPAPGVEKKTKAKADRKSKREKLLAKHGEIAGELWDLQEMLRASAIPRSRPLAADDERLERVCQRLEGKGSREECELVLRAYATEAKRNPNSAQWFNGVTNWRKKNFDTTLGGIGAEKTKKTGRAKPMARDTVTTTGEQDLRK